MRTKLSRRRARFYALIQEVFYEPTERLVAILRDPEMVATPDRRRFTALIRLACLRVLAGRDDSGFVYVERKRLVREQCLK